MARWWPGVALIALSCGEKDATPTDPPAGDADTDSDSDADTDADSDADADLPTAWARLVHTAPSLGEVELYFDGGAAPIGTFAPLVASGWQRPPVGARAFSVAPAGAGRGAAVATVEGQLVANQRYTLVVYGTDLAADAHGAIYREDASDLDADDLRFVFMNAVPGTEVDLVETSTGTVATNGVPYPTRVALPDAPFAPYTLGVDWDRDGAPECRFVLPSSAPGAILTLYLVLDRGDAKMLGQTDAGVPALLAAVEGACPPPFDAGGDTASTADTGP